MNEASNNDSLRQSFDTANQRSIELAAINRLSKFKMSSDYTRSFEVKIESTNSYPCIMKTHTVSEIIFFSCKN